VNLTLLQATPKCWLIRFVSSNRWLELAAWSTSKSGLKKWRWENHAKGRGKAWGRRLITPVLGVALWVE